MALKEAIALAPKVQSITEEVLARHIQRGDVVQATWLALVSGRPAFFLGSPGVDKTGTIQSLAERIEGARFFDALMPTVVSPEQLLVESTSIEEAPTANGGKQIRVRDELGRAAFAHLFFADEIWKAEARLLQTLIDLSKGDGVRHEGQMVKTDLMAFLAASNELPDPEGNLGAVWSRMTIRVPVTSLDRSGKKALVQARLNRDRSTGAQTASVRLTLDEVTLLRSARPQVEVPDDIVEITLDILQELVDETSADFQWAWDDDRRFGRLFDVMQAQALLQGRTTVAKQDLKVLAWLLWDTPEQIAVVQGKVAPYVRTPLSEAQELVDALLSPSGAVQGAIETGDASKAVPAVQQCQQALTELGRLKDEATTDCDRIGVLETQVRDIMGEVIAVVTGVKRGG